MVYNQARERSCWWSAHPHTIVLYLRSMATIGFNLNRDFGC